MTSRGDSLTDRIAGLSLITIMAVIAILLVLPGFSQSKTRPKTGPKPMRQAIPSTSGATLEELQRRVAALSAAVASGQPESVPPASRRVAALALRQLASLRMLSGSYPEAVELLRSTLALEDEPGTRLLLAQAALAAGEPEEAISQTMLLIERYPNDVLARQVNGKAWMAKNDYRTAVASLSRSLEYAQDPNTQYALAYCYLKLGEKPNAQRVFQKMIAQYGDRAIWHIVFAGAYRENQHTDDAIREFKRAIALDPTDSRAHFYLALSLLEANQWARNDPSMAEFRETLKLDPKNVYANLFLGIGESQLQRFEESNGHLKAASQLDPGLQEPWLYLGLNAFQRNDNDQAKQYLLKAIEATGSDESKSNYQIRRAYVTLGRIAFLAGKQEEAERYTRHAKQLQSQAMSIEAGAIAEMTSGMGQAPAVMPHSNIPKQKLLDDNLADSSSGPSGHSTQSSLQSDQKADASDLEGRIRTILSNCYNDWGTADARQKLYPLALQHFQEAERWNRATPGVMRNLGLAAMKVGDQTEAIRAFRSAVATAPQDQLARARLAMLLFSASNYDEAAPQFDALGDIAFSDPAVAYAWGYSLARTNQQKKAGEVLNRLTTSELPPELLLSIGDLYSVLQDYEHAVATYKRALQLNPAMPLAHYKMGAALIRLSRPAEAIPALESELKITPDDVDVQFNLSYALLQVSQRDRALSLLRSILATHPNHPQAQYQLGKTLLDDGQMEEAVQHLEAAAKLDPERDYIHYQLQAAYRKVGRKDDADREAKIYKDIKARKREQATIPMPDQDR